MQLVVGRITRPHADVDVAIWQQDFERVDRLLVQDGWRRIPQPGEDGYTGYGCGRSTSTSPSWIGTPEASCSRR